MSESGESESTAANFPVKDLTREAKWAADPEKQKQSIEELGSHGTEAIPALEEVKTVTAQEDIRKEVDAAIRGITRKEANASETRTKRSSPRKATKNDGKATSKRAARKSPPSSKRATKAKKNSRKKSVHNSKGRKK